MLCAISATSQATTTAPKDLGVLNKNQIEYWLKKRGELAEDANDAQVQAAIDLYIGKTEKSPEQLKLEAIRHQHSEVSHTTTKLLTKQQAAAQVSINQSSTETEVKVLALLVEFSDLTHDDNGLTTYDTSMYYADYSTEHYREMLFSSSGYEGPSGQTLNSAKQYYEDQSGGSFTFDGEVFGWIQVDNTAAYYGANDDDGDLNVQELVIEAVTKLMAQGVDLSSYDQTDLDDIDGDGITNEPDGIIDHVMLFHASIGEEAGGGILGSEAIWSHRFYVDYTPVEIESDQPLLWGYTINPIDAAIGVVVHEFGHDLGLPDEYDLGYNDVSEPVSLWSVMSTGSWAGSPSGTEPSSFSPYAKNYFFNRYGGNWIVQQELSLSELDEEGVEIDLVESVNHDGEVNQVVVELPATQEEFPAPYAGDYQYYSQAENSTTSSISWSVTLPSDASLLTLLARWEIEDDYDYAQVLINDQALAGDTTSTDNPYYGSIGAYISGDSSDLAASTLDGWYQLEFDVSAYAGQTVTLSVDYVTDTYVLESGVAIDEVNLTTSSGTMAIDDAETEGVATLDGFIRISDTIDGSAHRYFVELRSTNGFDSGLDSTYPYSGGVVVWYRNEAYTDNNVGEHPGYGFIGVVDADQNMIGTQDTALQIRDAAFGLNEQSYYYLDSYLEPNPYFDDALDYSSPAQPASGLVLPELGLSMEVVEHAESSETASVVLRKDYVRPVAAEFTVSKSNLTVTLEASSSYSQGTVSYSWDMGDGSGSTLTGSTASYSYEQAGTYEITLTATDDTSETTVTSQVTVAAASSGSSSTTTSSSGGGTLSIWSLLITAALVCSRRKR